MFGWLPAVGQGSENQNELFAAALEKADMGDADALALVAEADLHGRFGQPKDVELALEKFRQSASLGSALGQFGLGLIYDEGTIVERDLNEAFRLYELSASQGFAPAQNHLASLLIGGAEGRKDTQEGERLLRAAAAQGLPLAQSNLAAFLSDFRIDKNLSAESLELFRKAAAKDHPEAQFQLGQIYQGGFGVEENELQAIMLFRRAAEAGHSDAQLKLGMYYETGRLVEQDLDKALAWYQKAAASGNEVAIAHLAGTEFQSQSDKLIKTSRRAGQSILSWWWNSLLEGFIEPLVVNYSAIGIVMLIGLLFTTIAIIYKAVKTIVLLPLKLFRRKPPPESQKRVI